MTTLNFAKMHGLGNDFMVVDAIRQTVNLAQLPVTRLSHRHLGIGFDQLLLIVPSTTADFGCRILNADGSEAEQCGNGLRCVARYIVEKGLSKSSEFTISTKAGQYHAAILTDLQVQISMGLPNFDPALIPFLTPERKSLYDFKLKDEVFVQGSVLSMGNPHVVLEVASVADFPVRDIGKQISEHRAFPQSTNVGFMEIIDRNQIRLRTFERGTGETHSCGSNACAAVVAGIMHDNLDASVKVHLKYGELTVTWPEKTKPVLMTGPAIHIFDGTL